MICAFFPFPASHARSGSSFFLFFHYSTRTTLDTIPVCFVFPLLFFFPRPSKLPLFPVFKNKGFHPPVPFPLLQSPLSNVNLNSFGYCVLIPPPPVFTTPSDLPWKGNVLLDSSFLLSIHPPLSFSPLSASALRKPNYLPTGRDGQLSYPHQV